MMMSVGLFKLFCVISGSTELCGQQKVVLAGEASKEDMYIV